jgi:hypothetical protein
MEATEAYRQYIEEPKTSQHGKRLDLELRMNPPGITRPPSPIRHLVQFEITTCKLLLFLGNIFP